MIPRRARIGLALAAALCGCDVKITRGDLPEAPPPELVALGMAPGYKIREFESQAAVDAFCRANGVRAYEEYNKRRILACLVADQKTVAAPADGVVDALLKKKLIEHEGPHTWGFGHGPQGKGFVPKTAQARGLLALGLAASAPR